MLTELISFENLAWSRKFSMPSSSTSAQLASCYLLRASFQGVHVLVAIVGPFQSDGNGHKYGLPNVISAYVLLSRRMNELMVYVTTQYVVFSDKLGQAKKTGTMFWCDVLSWPGAQTLLLLSTGLKRVEPKLPFDQLWECSIFTSTSF
jgi:hypothetical protein